MAKVTSHGFVTRLRIKFGKSSRTREVELHFAHPNGINSCAFNSLEEIMSVAGQEESMEQTEAFLSTWRKFSPQDKPPDTEFLQFFVCDGERSPNEQVLERMNLCYERLEHAISVIKSEGFVLKWLTEVLNVKDFNESDSELHNVVKIFYPSTSFDAPFRAMDTAPKSVATEDGLTSSEYPSSKNVANGENSNLFVASDVNEGRNKTISKIDEAGFTGEPHTFDGSEDEKLQFGFNNIQEMAEVNSGKLFSRENNEFDEQKSLLYDDNNTAEGNKLLANNKPEERDEHDVSQTIADEGRNLTCSESEDEETMEDHTHDVNFPEKVKPAGVKNRMLATVFSPLAKGINKAKSKGKWRSPSGSKHRRSDSRDSATSGELEGDDVNLSHHTESKTYEDHDSEVLLDTGEIRIQLNDICPTNQENMAAEGGGICLDVNSPIDECRDVDLTRQGIPVNNEEKKDGESEESRCEETMDDSPDIFLEVVDDLISYLEGTEVMSSDEFEAEGESPHEEPEEGQDFMLFGGVIRPRKAQRFRKQLDSVMSLGNVSVMSADSCVSPWAIDVAACEMQSADSSAEEDNALSEASETKPSPEVSPGLPSEEPTKKQESQSTPPPVRPPRRSKTERLSRTLESPKKLKAKISLGDDEVFGKGYEGR